MTSTSTKVGTTVILSALAVAAAFGFAAYSITKAPNFQKGKKDRNPSGYTSGYTTPTSTTSGYTTGGYYIYVGGTTGYTSGYQR